MVAAERKPIPKGAKVASAGLYKPKYGQGPRQVRLYLTVPRKKGKMEIVTTFTERATRQVTDPQDRIDKFKHFICHRWGNGEDFEWPMDANTRRALNEFDPTLRDQDPIVNAPAPFYKKGELKAFRSWLLEKNADARVFVSHSKWKEVLQGCGRGNNDNIQGFYAHMEAALKKKLLIFDSVQDQIDREDGKDIESPQFKQLKGKREHVARTIDFHKGLLTTLEDVQKEDKLWKLLYSVKERDKIESIETPTFTMKQTQRVVNQGLMIASVLNDVVEYSRATLGIIDRGMETYTTNYVDPANGGRHGHEEPSGESGV